MTVSPENLEFGPAIAPPSVWQEHVAPFRHHRAKGVLDADTYARVAREFDGIVEVTDGSRDGPHRLSPMRRSYSAQVLGMNHELAEIFAPLFQEEWLRSIADFLEFPFVPRVEGALHSNPLGSKTGWIHTDLCSGWFDERDFVGTGVMYPPRRRCNYFTGRTRFSDAQPREYIRAATLIFYLCNDGWQPGDGGETGLYGAGTELPDTEVALVPPVNNSLVLFECSPHSHHRFVANPGLRRNSVILWLHSGVDDAIAKWGTAVKRPASD